VGISADTVARQARFAEQRAFDYPLLSDTGGKVSGQFGVSRGLLVKLGRVFIRRQESRHGRHSRHGMLTRLLMAVKRTTFVIDTDRTVLKVISSELRASMHADRALALLQERGTPSEGPVRSPDTDTHAIRQTVHDHSG
jgi:peroxiredoxin Q/BCP